MPFGHNIHGPKIGGVPLWGEEAPCNTMWPGPRHTSMPSGILIHPAVWPQYTGEKVGSAVPPPFWGSGWVSWELQTWAENLGAPPLLEQGAGSPSNTMWPGPRPIPPYQVASCSIQPFGHNRHGPKIGRCLFWGRGAVSPSNTVWPVSRPTSMPSFILIHPTVWPWPQYTNVSSRQTGPQSDKIHAMSISMSMSIVDLYSA